MEKFEGWWRAVSRQEFDSAEFKLVAKAWAHYGWVQQQAKIDELEKENKELVEALEKYGNTDNWSKQYLRQGRLGYQIKRELHEDGGKTARQALAKIKKENENG